MKPDFENLKLDEEEKELLESIERDEWISVKDDKEMKLLREAAKSTIKRLRKNKRINVRVSEQDLGEIKTIAMEEGIPYQTLISSILHKYVNGRFIEKPRT